MAFTTNDLKIDAPTCYIEWRMFLQLKQFKSPLSEL